jgi:hypothetical protein
MPLAPTAVLAAVVYEGGENWARGCSDVAVRGVEAEEEGWGGGGIGEDLVGLEG